MRLRFLDRWFVSRAAYEWCWRENDRISQRCNEAMQERDKALNESSKLLIVNHELAGKFMDGMEEQDKKYVSLNLSNERHKQERDTARAELAALRIKHNLLVHAINDAAELANQHDESTNCGHANGEAVSELCQFCNSDLSSHAAFCRLNPANF